MEKRANLSWKIISGPVNIQFMLKATEQKKKKKAMH